MMPIQTVDDFEALVFAQRPATQPWQPVTDYSFEARRVIEGEQPRLIIETFSPTCVLDYGCGYGHLVKLLLEHPVEYPGYHRALIVHGYEPNDAIRPGWAFSTVAYRQYNQVFDLVICREVLEHLTVLELRRVVADLCRLSSRYVYLTTRFNPAPASLLDVATADTLDPTHITMLNQDFLRVLLVLEGFRRRRDLEAAMDWQQKGRVLVYERAA